MSGAFWVRNILQALLFAGFVVAMYNSLSKIVERKVAVSETMRCLFGENAITLLNMTYGAAKP